MTSTDMQIINKSQDDQGS